MFPAIRPRFGHDVWTRENPLVNPLAVAGVRNGVIALADGRILKPAGIRAKASISSDVYDNALAIMLAQGVIVERDLGDGRAFLVCEPKFYNWCGTLGCGANNRWDRWAGGYFRCPLSPLLIAGGFAEAVLDEPGLNDFEKWRLEGTTQSLCHEHRQFRMSSISPSFAFDSVAREVAHLDETLDLIWSKPVPVRTAEDASSRSP
ncbi:MAG: hypothetical protein KF691_14085 [Phycisphaeraceae bacterium]|nr:hypothetical protein [Phycisphaeraceae bacterium]